MSTTRLAPSVNHSGRTGSRVSVDKTSIPVNGHTTSKSPALALTGQSRWAGWSYPQPPNVGGATEVIHGVEIKDPWRELEDPEKDETKRFVREQNELSIPLLRSHPHRQLLEDAVRQVCTYERTSVPSLMGDGYYYWTYNQGSWSRDIVVRSKDLQQDFGRLPEGIQSPDPVETTDVATKEHRPGPEVVFNPNQEDMISIYAESWSPCGRFYCVILQEAGSDWQKIRTLDTTTRQPIEDDLIESKFTFGTSWIGSNGFIYKKPIRALDINGNASASSAALAEADGQYAMFYHHLKTPQCEDVMVWYGTGPNARNLITGRPIDCSWDLRGDQKGRRWVFWDIHRSASAETESFIFELPLNLDGMSGRETGMQLKRLIGQGKWLSRGFTGSLHYIGTLSNDTHLFEGTANGYTLGRIVAITAADIDQTVPGGDVPFTQLIPSHPSGFNLLSANLVKDSVLVLVYLRDACAAVVFADARTGDIIGASDQHGTLGHAMTTPSLEIPVPAEELDRRLDAKHAVAIPAHATISSVSSRSDSADFYFSVDTFVAPPYVLSGVILPGVGEPDIKLSRIDHAPAPEEDLVCTQTFYESFDGVKIPLFISHARDLDLTRPQPTLVHAYGGFGVCSTPQYNHQFTTFMRHVRGIVAVACIRGGGEYGADWHECARQINRFICYEDFSHAAKYLHAVGLTTPALTASYGVSNGGTLVAASMNRDPHLWRAVCPDVGVFDSTRFHLFTIGRLWKAEAGDPEDPMQLQYIHAMSPLHSVKADDDIVYPAVFLTTADHDVRVIPGHTLKMLAELQAKRKNNPNIFLGRIYENAGHEVTSKSTEQKVEEAVDRLVFIISAIGL
ncbi:prolyl oligopeptidase family-domain-containing protein [Kockovaella imperatae]|uniref:Prolyl endopeptidase n=1 Tax=Kockovaella imperatae TaxID=4999 RepID=A0A1Y1UIK8_9TREE|nr:prolyl oligopeptidase family-domain-containing protein [Kockovaella imperatae]ORX36935.1 prolyl oligopeptidase family-domain-containing protein [Kockovaella imperatae]